MSLSLFLSVTMFLVLLTRVIPAAESVSILSIYYVGSMAVMAGSSVLCIFTVGLQQQGQLDGDIPTWMENLFLRKMAKWLLISIPDFVKLSLIQVRMIMSSKQVHGNVIYLSPEVIQKSNSIMPELLKCLECVRNTRMELQTRTQHTLIKNRWSLVTQCLDRLFAIVFICITGFTIYWCLISSRTH